MVVRKMVDMKSQPMSKKEYMQKFEIRHGPGVRRRFPGKVEINLKHFKMSDLKEIACGLKDSNITILRLFCLGPDCEILRFSATDQTTFHILMRFFRELAKALGVGGWLKHLELGFKQLKRDLTVLTQAIGCSTTLQELSLANSRLGDAGLQILAEGLCNCPPLQILNLSGCALSDSSHVSLASILKASVGLKAEAEWQSSLRGCEFGKGTTKIQGLALHRGLYALDLSFNFLSDTSAKHICNVLRVGAPLAALNLQGNQMQRKSMKRFISIFEMWGILQIVDLRGNLDQKGVCVLENGEHLSFFSVPHEPFWRNSGSHGGIQTLRGLLTTSQALKKGSSPRSGEDCVTGFTGISHPRVDEAVTMIGHQVLSSSEESRSTSEMKQIPGLGTCVLSLRSPVDVDMESADPTTILSPNCRTDKSEFSCTFGSKTNTVGLGIASIHLCPPCNYLSTPTHYSAYSDDMHMCEDYSSPVDLTCDWDNLCTPISTDDTQMSSSPRSPSYRTYDHSIQQPQADATQCIQSIHHHSTVHDHDKLSEPGMQYPLEGKVVDEEIYTAFKQLRTEFSEESRDDSEWDAFMNDMARKLQHVQEGFDAVISCGKPDFLITAQTEMTTLQEGLQQLLVLET